jgi:DNA-binding response OmpR family regulator
MEHILVVDDKPTNRKLLNRLLTAKGYAVTEADSGSRALELFRAGDYDLVLMDILMPGMNGHEATTQIKTFSGESHTPVIFVTALSSDEAYTQSLEAGGDDFLSKPINAAILEAKIKAHLRIKELSRRLEAQNQVLREHNQYLTRERELVKHLFEEVLQRNFKHPDCIRQHISPMSAFNGDLLLVERGPGGRLYLLLGDFTGHGLAAAMGTFPVTQVFFDMAQAGAPVGDVVRELNRQLKAFLPSNMFFCATLVQVNMLSGELLVWSGGQPDAYITRSLSENRGPTAEKPFRPDSPIKIVKYAQYSPHLIEKSDSKWLPLATTAMDGGSAGFAGATNRSAPILGQTPRATTNELHPSRPSLSLHRRRHRGEQPARRGLW